MPKPIKKPKAPSQRDRGYSNILHHLSEASKARKTAQKQNNDTLKQILKGIKELMATAAESAAELAEIKTGLTDVKTQLQKAFDEITAKIQALVDAANNAGNTPPEVQAAIDDLKSVDLKSVSQALDDIVPDQPTP